MQNTSVISREIVNKNIKFGEYDYENLCKEIDRFKNILQHHNAQKGQTIFNFLKGIRSISLFLASSELGLKTCVVDMTSNVIDLHNKNKNYIDAKCKGMSPINFVFYDEVIERKWHKNHIKYHYIMDIAEKTLYYDKDFDCTYNDTMNADGDTALMISSSSGTTGTPKTITHTHSFMSKLAKRNSKSFFGNVMCTRIFHHGSSFATFFLPMLVSSRVSKVHFEYTKKGAWTEYLTDIDHIQFPYTNDIRRFIKENKNNYPKLNVYTLAKIDIAWKELIGVKVNDIISLFGSTETSGPIFTQNLSDKNFKPDRFVDPDGWYNAKIIDGKLNLTGDRFEYNDDGTYRFLGRDDVVKIQNVKVSLQKINLTARKIIGNCHVTFDTKFDKVYLCVFNNQDDLSDSIEKFNSLFSLNIDTKIFAEKDINKFICGIKIDNESIRDYFRYLT